MNPCVDYCYIRFGKQYTPDCDVRCDYAQACNELKIAKGMINPPTKLSPEEFVRLHCQCCGSQRCEGIGTVWFDGCKYKEQLE